MIAKTGDIFILGDHRLLCGDSMTGDLQSLCKEKIRLIATDPPYGVAYVENKKSQAEGTGQKTSENREIANDQLQSPTEYSEFSQRWLEKVKPFMDDYNAVYIFNAELMYCALRDGMEKAGYYYSQMLIWIKNSVVMGRKDYLPQHELIAYGWYGKHKFERSKGKSVIAHAPDEKEVGSLIYEDKRSSSKLHPTMKPVGLMRKLILNSSKIGEVVYDPFGGSGSTLMACEHTKRKCYMVEVDPVYCDTIIARWEKLTGKKAIKENGE